MRILIVSNFYPPHTLGGYEIHCALKAERLAALGHSVTILTSTYGTGGASPRESHPHGISVTRRLPYEQVRRGWTMRQLWAYERAGATAARAALYATQPDVAYVWNMWWMPLSTLLVLQQSGVPAVYQIDHNWMLEWVPDDPWLKRWRPGLGAWKNAVRAGLRPVLYRLGILTAFDQVTPREAIFVSHFRRDEHVASNLGHVLSPAAAHVITNGTVIPAAPRQRQRTAGDPLRLLHVSRYLTPAKGIDTVLWALARLRDAGEPGVTLDVFGEFFPNQDAYQAEVMALAAQLQGIVTLRGARPHADLLAAYWDYDALVFASNIPEGLPLTLVEALAHGLPVIGTPVGGASEALPPQGSLSYDPGDDAALAQQIRRLRDEPDALPILSAGARTYAEQEFDLAKTVAQTEYVLLSAARRAGTVRP